MGAGDVQRQRLSVVVPAYNEERRLPTLFAALEAEADAAADAAGFALVEVIVVDDGSVDRTAEVLASFAALPGRFRTLRLEGHRGKGAAVQAGLLDATEDVALVTDVDLSAPLSDLAVLAGALRAGADVVLGSRALPESRIVVRQSAARQRLGQAFNRVLRMLTGLPYRDTQCGFKLLRLDAARPVVERLRVAGFAFDAELCVRARTAGLAVVEVPVTWANNPDTRVGTGSALRMGVDLVRIAWWSRRKRRT